MIFELAACAIGVCILFAVAFVLVVQGEQEDPLKGLPDRPPPLLTEAQRNTEWGRIIQKNVDAFFYAQSSCWEARYFHRVALMDILQAMHKDVDELIQVKKRANLEPELESILEKYEQQLKDKIRQVLGRCPTNTTIQIPGTWGDLGPDRVLDVLSGRNTKHWMMVKNNTTVYAQGMQGDWDRNKTTMPYKPAK